MIALDATINNESPTLDKPHAPAIYPFNDNEDEI